MTGQAVYRMFDSEGRLLYIGQSVNVLARLQSHASRTDWYEQIATVTVEHFAGREEAHAAEVEAIAAEQPLYNVRHTGRPQPSHSTIWCKSRAVA